VGVSEEPVGATAERGERQRTRQCSERQPEQDDLQPLAASGGSLEPRLRHEQPDADRDGHVERLDEQDVLVEQPDRQHRRCERRGVPLERAGGRVRDLGQRAVPLPLAHVLDPRVVPDLPRRPRGPCEGTAEPGAARDLVGGTQETAVQGGVAHLERKVGLRADAV